MKKENPVYTIVRIEEPDFGCEGRGENEAITDKVFLKDEDGTISSVDMEEKLVWQRGLDEGMQVSLDGKGKLFAQLETKRLILRPWRMDDAEDLYAYASSTKVGPMAGWKPHDNIEESKQILEMFVNDGDTWAIEWKENHKVIGSIGLHQSKMADIEYDRELGYVLSEDYWGQGIIPEAAERIKQFAFENLKISRLLVEHFDFNNQSKRVIEKLGFPYLKHVCNRAKRYDGVVLDEEVYLMTRDDFLKQMETMTF